MFIRKTACSKYGAKQYFTYRLVENVRTGNGTSQRIVLNLGIDFSFPKESWRPLAKRIEQILYGQRPLFASPDDIEVAAQQYAAKIIRKQGDGGVGNKEISQHYSVDIDSLETSRPRSVSVEHVAYETVKEMGLEQKLTELGLTRPQRYAAIGTIVGRMVHPGSELATHDWLQNKSGLGELIGSDFEEMNLYKFYQASDLLLKNKDEIESYLYKKEKSVFQFKETITLYDLTNTYLEGSGKYNKLAALGKSKEKRTDCPLVTLGLVLDASGFPKRSEIFSGNVGEASTLEQMITELHEKCLNPQKKPTIVMDAGIATEKNITWLKENGYKYIVVSRKRKREFCEQEAIVVKRTGENTVKAQRKINEETGEIELYCHSTLREKKEQAMQDCSSTRFEEELKKLHSGLHKKYCTKKYEKVVEKLGRLKQQYSRSAQHYQVDVDKDEKTGNASQVTWKRKDKQNTQATHPGVYCLRTNHTQLDESALWHTYTMLTELEAVFRCLKSELGLRPIHHQITSRVSGHLFITLLAYHLVHSIRYRLKQHNIHSSWDGLRRQLDGQVLTTTSMKCEDGEMLHIRKSTAPEPRQQIIYDALEMPYYPGGTVRKKMKIKKSVVPRTNHQNH
ncbi:MAG: IS1634 family transposase [Candidatus Electrothrix communis]|nr:MAG: IS1634 family transposase [Candidatus Electrothrix communis]